ncbi:MAG: 3-deoxy-D-arabino-heptulosonate 7-phosphate synthase [Opitutales bacterium]|nr:3-deoxy-D-arabino-heptulosonate 7-phosphate synthase [Opitutales bacterium]
MIIPKKSKLTSPQLQEIENIVTEFGCRIQVITGAHQEIYAILGDERRELMISRIEGLSYIDRVDTIQSPYKLMDFRSSLAGHKVTIGKAQLGSEPVFIAGPCTIDPKNPNLFYETAAAIKEVGAHALRGGVWKPRTTPHSYQGDRAALDILLEGSARTGLPVITEIMDEAQLKEVESTPTAIYQIGTRNALNYSLLKAIGASAAKHRKAVLLKRGRHMAPIDEFLSAAEYLTAAGTPDIILCPRGTTPPLDGYRNHPDESITPLLKEKTWAPVVVDPSHSVGKALYVPAASLAAMAYGADGLCLECHLKPREGLGDDPKQAITPEVLEKLIKDCRTIWETPSRWQSRLKE